MKKISLFLLTCLATQQLIAERTFYETVSIYQGALSALAFTGGVYALARGQAGPLSTIIKRIRPNSTYSANTGKAMLTAWVANSVGESLTRAAFSRENNIYIAELDPFVHGLFATQYAITRAPFMPLMPITKPLTKVLLR